MRKAARCAVLVAAYALVAPVALPMQAEASSPTLTLVGASSGPIGSGVTYAYSWDCTAPQAGVTAGDSVILVWQNPGTNEQIGATTVAIGADCTGTVSGRVPGDASVGNSDVSTAYIQHASIPVAGSEALANRAFVVTAAPTPTPKPTPRATPSPRPRPTTSPSSAVRRGAAPKRDPKAPPPANSAGVIHSADAGPGGPSSGAAIISATSPNTGGPGLLARIPGGWLGLGLFTGVGLLAAVVVAFLTMERRRFARMYPKDGSRRQR